MFEVEEWLHSRIGLNFRSGLGRMQRAVDLLGNPERDVYKRQVCKLLLKVWN